jgi:putative MATE family efflux protein
MTDAAKPGTPVPLGVSGPISHSLLRLALPILASHVLRLAYQWVDALWVRGLGVEATAAVTTSVFVMWWMYSANDVFAIGVVAYVSQLLGAGERQRAGVAASLALRGSLILGLVGSAIGILFASNIYGLMGSDPGTLEKGTSYLSIVLFGSPVFMIALTSEGIMRAAGDSRTPFFIDLVAIGLNILLDPILIYGFGPIPAFGVAGAAWATISTQGLAALAYLYLARRGHRAFPMARHAAGPAVKLSGVLRVGVPAAAIGILFSLVYIVFAGVAGRYGTASLAIVGIINRLEALEYMVSVAIGLAGAALVGQNLGANRPDRAVQVIRVGTRWVVIYSLILSVLMMAFPQFFLSLFTADPETIRVGSTYLRIVAWCFVFNGIEIVVAESILGSGHTVAISVIFTVFSLLRLPLAFLVPQLWDMGVLGIAWVISITCVARSLTIIAWASRGTWKRGLKSTLGADPASPVGEP